MSDQEKLTSVLDENKTPMEMVSLEKSKVDILRVANGSAFVIAMILNATAQNFSKATNAEVVAQWQVKIAPAGWAFSIWGIIFTLLAGFTIYQGIPNDKISGGQTQSVIFGKVGYLYSINWLLNAAWICIFGMDNLAAFIITTFIIIGMYVTGMKILQIAVAEKLNNWWEKIFFRGGFSIYVGWLTAASILNVCFVLKGFGVDPQNTDVPNEMFWSKVILLVALVLYTAYTFVGRNPLFGIIYVWVLLAIKSA